MAPAPEERCQGLVSVGVCRTSSGDVWSGGNLRYLAMMATGGLPPEGNDLLAPFQKAAGALSAVAVAPRFPP